MNTWGNYLRVTTFGESHGPACGAILDGLPAGWPLDNQLLQSYVARRRPGQPLTSARREEDRLEIWSGLWEGRLLGTPLTLAVRNGDTRSQDYRPLAQLFRPGHGDYPWRARYGHCDYRGGGRASARETVARVLAGGVAEQLLAALWPPQRPKLEIAAWVESVGPLALPYSEELWQEHLRHLKREQIDSYPTRCPWPEGQESLVELLNQARAQGDSWGGVVVWVARHLPAGWGEPVFGRLDGLLGGALLSIPGVKGVEMGKGFALAAQRGSQVSEGLIPGPYGPRPRHDWQGGSWGGISNGGLLWGRVAFKPTSSIAQPQESVDLEGQSQELKIEGRHDPCIALRGAVVVEAMIALVLADLALAQRGLRSTKEGLFLLN